MAGNAQARMTAMGGRDARAATLALPPLRPAQWALPYRLLLLFVFLMYSQLSLVAPALQAARPVYAVGGAAILALLVERLLSRRGLQLVWPESYLLLGFLGAAALSCLTALWPNYAFENTLQLAKGAALYFVMVNCIDTARRLHGLVCVMVLSGLFPALGALRLYADGVVVEGSRAAWIGIFANPNDLAYSLVLLLPLAAYAAARAQSGWKALYWSLIALYVATIWITFSRGGMLGLVTVAVFSLMTFGTRRLWLRFALLALLAVGLIFVRTWWERGAGFTELRGDANVQQRLATIRGGFAMFLDHPLLGVGTGCSVVAWPLYAPPEVAAYQKWLVIHNTLVQVLSETGILGFSFFISLLAGALFGARRLARSRRGQGQEGIARMAAGVEISLWGFLVCSLSGGYALSWFPYLVIGLFSCAKKILATPGADRRGLPVKG